MTFGHPDSQISMLLGNIIVLMELKSRKLKISFPLVMIENKFAVKVWSYWDKLDAIIFSLNLLNTNGLNILNIILT